VTDGFFEPLRHEIESYLEPHQVAEVHRAYVVARDAHIGQNRISGEAYITHPVAAAVILAKLHLDYQSLMATLLHDVIEDTGISKHDIAKEFGEVVAALVDGVSKLTQIEFSSKREAQAENFRKMVLAMVRDIRVILVKLADRLHNMQTICCMPIEKRRRIAIETLEIYAPIANRLGIHAFYTELEDLGFKALYPMRYRILFNSMHELEKSRQTIFNSIETRIIQALHDQQVPVLKVVGRMQHLYGVYKRMKARDTSFNEIMDVYCFRVIVERVDTCYRALGAVHGAYKPRLRRFKDYIAIPKANGYQSLHTTVIGPLGVPIDIQIRTDDMDHVAEYGIAAHWRYKTGMGSEDAGQKRAREWINKLLEVQQTAANSLEFIENVKIDLYPDLVYAFTPKGHIIELPRGATPVDFAYAIHSDVGNSCVAAKVDRRLAPLSQPLVNGQSVEIITASGARPNPAWLHFVTTTKARSNIRHFLKTQQSTESVSLGERLLEQALASLGSSLAVHTPAQIDNLVKSLHKKTMVDLCREIGLGNFVPAMVARQLLTLEQELSGEIEHVHKPTEPLVIKGTEGMVLRFAECCRPIPGDSIVGTLVTGKGIMVHRAVCPKVMNVRFRPEKYIDMVWETKGKSRHEFPTNLRIEVKNDRGVLAEISSTIAKMDANIENISVDPRDGYYNDVFVCINVRNRQHLARIMNRLRHLKSVRRIIRIKKGMRYGTKNN
jgi:guanosine-3',5'-bis(diphosphate) 3'-pyrophosphohydrolase